MVQNRTNDERGDRTPMQKMEKPRKPLMFYYLIVLVVVILLNTLLFPRLMQQQVT